MARDLEWLIGNIEEDNLADQLDEDELSNLGQTVKRDYDTDKESRADWEKANEKGMELAKQLSKGRTYAGEAVSDVMYPAIATAAIQYSSRSFPSVIKNDEVVKAKPIGRDDDGSKAARGTRVATHMNYQIMEQMDGWEDDMDKMLITHSILGDYFKKIYYDPVEKINKSELISPEFLVVNYWAKSLKSAQQKTHIVEYSHNEYLEFVRSGVFSDIELDRPDDQESPDKQSKVHTFLEQHRFFDLDGDDYEEPYIVTIHEETCKVVRVVARYDENGITLNKDGEIVKIKPKEYFVKFPFLPSLDGSFYGIGFGIILSPINKSVNTVINQLLDAGTRSTRQSGFLGSNVRMLRGGESGTVRLRPGEWKMVQARGGDLRQNIVHIPSGEPSNVLFQLLGLMLEALKVLSSQSDLLAGSQQQHNVPATTTLALIEQGLKVFAGIYKRVFNGLKSEFKMLYILNRDYQDEQEYVKIVDDKNATMQDYESESFDIIPVSTSSTITDTQKYMKAQAMREWYGTPGINSQAIANYYFTALEIPAPIKQEILTPPQPQPSFAEQIEFEKLRQNDMKLRLDAEKIEGQNELNFHKAGEMRSKILKNLAEAESREIGAQMGIYKQQADLLMADVEKINAQIEMMDKLKKEREAEEAAQRQQANQQQGGGQ